MEKFQRLWESAWVAYFLGTFSSSQKGGRRDSLVKVCESLFTAGCETRLCVIIHNNCSHKTDSCDVTISPIIDDFSPPHSTHVSHICAAQLKWFQVRNFALLKQMHLAPKPADADAPRNQVSERDSSTIFSIRSASGLRHKKHRGRWCFARVSQSGAALVRLLACSLADKAHTLKLHQQLNK
jgi:hypothetical protein